MISKAATRTALPKAISGLLAAAIALLLLSPATASAHSGVESYLYLDVTIDELGGRLELPFEDVRAVFGYELDEFDPIALLAELRANESELVTFMRDHVSVGADGMAWDYEVTNIEILEAEGGYAVIHFIADVPGTTVPRQLDVTLDPFFDDVEDRSALLLIGNDWQGGVIDNGEEALVGFDPDTRQRLIDLGDSSQWNNFTASIEQGLDHIRTGPDHILFVIALLLPAVLVFTTAWHPVSTFGASLWRIMKIVTMFTVAHSITFVLAGLDVLPLPPSRLVETLIAASIVVTALHGLRPVIHNREWAIAFVFGLFHGMGFASLVSGLDVSQTTQMVSLLGRNVGIEVGQTIVVVLLFPGLFLLRRTQWYRPLFVLFSIGLAVVAFGWMLERLFETDLRVNKLIDPIVEFPRALVLVVALTAIATVVHQVEARAGRLLPTFDLDGATGVAHVESDESRETVSS